LAQKSSQALSSVEQALPLVTTPKQPSLEEALPLNTLPQEEMNTDFEPLTAHGSTEAFPASNIEDGFDISMFLEASPVEPAMDIPLTDSIGNRQHSDIDHGLPADFQPDYSSERNVESVTHPEPIHKGSFEPTSDAIKSYDFINAKTASTHEMAFNTNLASELPDISNTQTEVLNPEVDSIALTPYALEESMSTLEHVSLLPDMHQGKMLHEPEPDYPALSHTPNTVPPHLALHFTLDSSLMKDSPHDTAAFASPANVNSAESTEAYALPVTNADEVIEDIAFSPYGDVEELDTEDTEADYIPKDYIPPQVDATTYDAFASTPESGVDASAFFSLDDAEEDENLPLFTSSVPSVDAATHIPAAAGLMATPFFMLDETDQPVLAKPASNIPLTRLPGSNLSEGGQGVTSAPTPNPIAFDTESDEFGTAIAPVLSEDTLNQMALTALEDVDVIADAPLPVGKSHVYFIHIGGIYAFVALKYNRYILLQAFSSLPGKEESSLKSAPSLSDQPATLSVEWNSTSVAENVFLIRLGTWSALLMDSEEAISIIREL
jgi:hypothetical protein